MNMPLVEIGECCDIVNGSTPSRKEPEYWDGDIDWLTPKDLGHLESKYIFDAPEKITELGYKSCSTTLVPEGSLLYTSRAPIGHLAINKKVVCTNQGFKTLVPKENVEVEFLYYVLKKYTPNLQDLGNGATFKELSKSTISSFKIPLPPLGQQKKIAAILDAADYYRLKTKALIGKYEELGQSLFLEMFGDPVRNPKGWEVDILGNYCKKIQIGPFGSQLHKSDYVKEGIPLINPTNIRGGEIEYSNSVKITKSKYNSLPNYHLNIGDVIMARRGDLSKIGIVDRVKSFCGTGSLYLRLKENINSIFGYWLLSHHSTVDKLYEKSQGVTMPNLNKRIIINLPLIIPPISLQNQFAKRINVISSQKNQAQANSAKAEDLFNSLLQKAFKGELT